MRATSILILAALTLAAVPGRAEGGRQLAVYAGQYDWQKPAATEELGLELRIPARWRRVRWMAGGATSADSAWWIYGGAQFRQPLGKRWALAPGFAVSFYEAGDGKDLGGPVEFRSSLELSVDLGSRVRLGALVYHLSNAGLYGRNPGSNSFLLTWSLPSPW